MEDNEREIEDFVPEDPAQAPQINVHTLSKPENWVHHTPNILLNGRVSHADPENLPEDADPEVVKKQIEARDPYEKRLKPIALDKSVPVGSSNKASQQAAGVVRLFGDSTDYFNPIKPTQKINNGVVVVRSLQWPGAFTLYSGNRTLSIYVGNGHKYEGSAGYFPLFPPKIMNDPAEFVEQPEPTPLTMEAPKPVVEAEKPAEENAEEAPAE